MIMVPTMVERLGTLSKNNQPKNET